MTLKERIFQKKNIWHLGAILLFVLVASIYYSPTYSGHSIEQDDVKNWSGAAQEILDYRYETGEEALWTNSMFGGMPATQISVNNNSRIVFNFLRNSLTFWLPHPVDYLLLCFISFYILAMSLKVRPLIGVIGSLAYGLSTFFIIILKVGHNTQLLAIGFAPLVIAGFLLAYRRKKWFTGVALSALFMSFELSANHPQMTYYLAFILIGLGIVELIKHIKNNEIVRFGKITGSLLFAYFISLGISYGTIKDTTEYAKYTTRGDVNLTINSNGTDKDKTETTNGLSVEYITAYSYGIDETFNLMIPNFKGGKSGYIGGDKSNKSLLKSFDKKWKEEIKTLQRTANSGDKDDNIKLQALQRVRTDIKTQSQYWGAQLSTAGPGYIGVIIIFLAILALYYLDDKLKWAFLVVSILAILLSWGKNFLGFTEFFINYLPGYNKFRSVTFILFIVEISAPILAMLFINKLYINRNEIIKNIKPFYTISGTFLGFFIIMYLFPNLFNSFLLNQEAGQLNNISDPDQFTFVSNFYTEVQNVRIGIFRKDLLRSIFFLIIPISAILLALRNENFAKKGLIPVLIVFVFADLILVDTRLLGNSTSGKDAQWIKKWEQTYPYKSAAGDKTILLEESKSPEIAELISNETSKVKKDLRLNKVKGGESNKIVEWHEYRSLNRNTHFRVYEKGNPFNSTRTSYFHKSIGGYHGAKLRRFQDLIEFHISRNNSTVLDMLNTKYFLEYGGKSATANPTVNGNAWFVQNINEVNSANDEILGLCGSYKLESLSQLPLLVNKSPVKSIDLNGIEDVALIVPRDETFDTIPVQLPISIEPGMVLSYIQTAESGLQWQFSNSLDSNTVEILKFQSLDKFDSKTTAILHSDYSNQLSKKNYSGQGNIELTEYKPNHLTYLSNTEESQLAVFSEVFYPNGWTATIDNKEVEILRSNYALRALEIPSGEHTIEFKYNSKSFQLTKTVTWLSTIVIVMLLLLAVYFELKSTTSENK